MTDKQNSKKDPHAFRSGSEQEDIAWLRRIRKQEKIDRENGTLVDDKGIRNLWAAVFEQAVNDATLGFYKRTVEIEGNPAKFKRTTLKRVNLTELEFKQARDFVAGKTEISKYIHGILGIEPADTEAYMKRANKFLPEQYQYGEQEHGE